MSRSIDPRCHVGETHGIYTLVDVLEEKDRHGHYIYKGICNECGFVKFSHYGGFSGSTSVTNICNHIDVDGTYMKYVKWENSRIGGIFSGMKCRCYNENDKDYRWYGGKGIRICNEWINNPKLFENWSLENGYTDNMTIDRKDESKDYCPENCQWIEASQNSKYKSTTSLIECNGEVHTGRDWAEILGLGTNIINNYVRKYGVENTVIFMQRFMENPIPKTHSGKSYYNLYMYNKEI